MMSGAAVTVFFERDLLLARVEGDGGFLKELVEAFECSQQESIEGLRAALVAGVPAQLEKHAHSLKGAVQNFASGKIVALIYRLELMGRSADLAGGDSALDELKPEVDALRVYLRKVADEL